MELAFKSKKHPISKVSAYVVIPVQVARLMSYEKEYMFVIKEVETNGTDKQGASSNKMDVRSNETGTNQNTI